MAQKETVIVNNDRDHEPVVRRSNTGIIVAIIVIVLVALFLIFSLGGLFGGGGINTPTTTGAQ